MLTKSKSKSTSRPARDPYPGDNRSPGSPLDVAIAEIERLDLKLNPLGSEKWAEKILRRDIARIVHALATATATGLKETIAAQNAAIERLQARVEADAQVARTLESVQWSAKRGGEMTCPTCFNTEAAGHSDDCAIGQSLTTWETSRKEKTV